MEPSHWRPGALWGPLKERAALLAAIRSFFAKRGVLEVETPLLSAATVTDLHLHSLTSVVHQPDGTGKTFYLQTSPEFAMKRLLAAGSGPIYQICKAFRDQEEGRQHNPEFTMLEWYRPGFDHHALMDEIDALIHAVLGRPTAERLTYAEAFERILDLDPHRAKHRDLAACATAQGFDASPFEDADRNTWLQLLLSHFIEPRLGRERPTFVYDFPTDQAALARVREGDPPVAERFELYIDGVELANGFHELDDADEQRRRFEKDLLERRRQGLESVPLDERLLAALEHGLPNCAGVAMGIDRLAMLRVGATSLEEVTAFLIDRA